MRYLILIGLLAICGCNVTPEQSQRLARDLDDWSCAQNLSTSHLVNPPVRTSFQEGLLRCRESRMGIVRPQPPTYVCTSDAFGQTVCRGQ